MADPQAQPTPDPLTDLLAKAPIGQGVRADAWDAFHQSANEDDLAAKLQRMPMPQATKAALWDLKHTSAPESSPLMTYAVVNGQRVPITDDKPARTWGDTATDVGIGLAKGVGGTITSLGSLVHDIPGVSKAVDALYGTPGLSQEAFKQAAAATTPTNTPQAIGKGAEQIGEAVLAGGPIRATGEAAAAEFGPYLSPALAQFFGKAAVEAGGNAAIAKAQGASNTATGVTAALSAALAAPGALAVKLADKYAAEAPEHVYQFFSPTARGMKAIIQKRTPEVLERGSDVLGTLGSTRQSAAELFGTQREAAGEAINDALSTYGRQDIQNAPQRIMAALDAAKQPYVKNQIAPSANAIAPPLRKYIVGTFADGRVQLELPLNGAKVAQINGLKNLVGAYGDKMSIDDLVGVRRAWDEIAYARPGATLDTVKTQAAKWARKMGGDAIRGIVQSDKPDFAKLNQEFSFWRDLETVMDATNQRKVGQVGGLLPPMAEGAGRVAGAALATGHGAASGIGTAFAAGKLARLAQQVFASPRYNSLAANLKTRIADAITNGSAPASVLWLGQAAKQLGVIEGPKAVIP